VIDESSLREMRASFERSWLEHATNEELRLLERSAERPELFDPDDGSIRVLLDPSLGDGGEMVTRSPTAAAPQIPENVAGMVFHRTRLRARLGLPQDDCAQPSRSGRGTCTCLTQTLDALDHAAADRETVLVAARKLHKRSRPRLRVRKRQAPSPPAAVAVMQPAPILAPLTQTSTKPGLTPRLRPDRGPPIR
jgi:hypothetical protein